MSKTRVKRTPSGDAPAPSGLGGRSFGDGAFPAELRWFNWGAFLAWPLWALAHGPSWVFALFLFYLAVGCMLGSLAGPLGHPEAGPWIPYVALALYLPLRVIALWLGFKANELHWRDYQAQWSVNSPRRSLAEKTVADYAKAQRRWLVVGAALFASTTVLPVLTGEALPARAVAIGYVLTATELAVGALLALAMKRRRQQALPAVDDR